MKHNYTSVSEVVADIAAGKLSAEDGSAVINDLQARGQRLIKLNGSGGLYVKDPSFQCFSAKKKKVYTGAFNIDRAISDVLFGEGLDPKVRKSIKEAGGLLDAICEFVETGYENEVGTSK